MKTILKAIVESAALLALAAVLLNLNGCTKVEAPSLYNPNLGNGPQPVVDSLTPSGSALAGVDTMVIYGKNFLADKDSDGVDFLINGKLAASVDSKGGDNQIISASTTKLVLKAPAISGDTVQVLVWTLVSADFSPMVNYQLNAAIAPFSTLANGESAYGITVGPDDSLYVSISNINLSGTKDEGIFQIGPVTGVRAANPYALPTAGNVDWADIKFGSGGDIYGVKGVRAVYKLSQGKSGTPWAVATGASFSCLDFDQNGNLWVGGNNKEIYMISPSASIKTFPFTGNVRAMRYYNGDLYFAANVGTAESQVFQAPVIGDSLGTPQMYFDLSTDPTGGNNIYAITFSADGDMYAGTDSSDYLIVVHPGGTVEKPYSLYINSGVLNSPCKSFTWVGENLYATTASGEILKILARKQGAPYYGF